MSIIHLIYNIFIIIVVVASLVKVSLILQIIIKMTTIKQYNLNM